MEFPVILGIHSVAQDFKGSFRFEYFNSFWFYTKAVA